MDKPVINETFTDDYVLHVFKVPIKMDQNWQPAEQALLEAARQQCNPFLEQARQHFQRLGKDRGLAVLSVEPRVTVLIPIAGELELLVRIAVPVRRKGRIEQAILRSFVSSAIERVVREEGLSVQPVSPSTNDSADPGVGEAA